MTDVVLCDAKMKAVIFKLVTKILIKMDKRKMNWKKKTVLCLFLKRLIE